MHGESDASGGDALGHGTACILRVLQVAPDAEIIPIRVFQDRLETSVGVLCDAIRVAQNLGAGIINLSLATRRTDATEPLYRVCEEARREGVVLVAAADNGGGHAIPAFLEPVLSVEQGNQKNLLDFTYHPGAAIECTAAGRGVPIPRPSGAPLLKGGSSVAAATMSGILARLLERGPGDLDRVRRFLVALSSTSSNPEPHAAHPTSMEARNS
jgi:subtilisin family serine protease